MVVAAVGSGFVTAVVGRGLQGFAMALMPVGISMMRDVLPPERLGSGVALMSATIGIGSVLGMPLAGVLHEHLGWQSLFWVPARSGVRWRMAVLLVRGPGVEPRARGPFRLRGCGAVDVRPERSAARDLEGRHLGVGGVCPPWGSRLPV